jgi:hypothetical protein
MTASYQAITALLSLAITAMAKAAELKRIASQNRELTDDEETELDTKIANLAKQAHWQKEPDPE